MRQMRRHMGLNFCLSWHSRGLDDLHWWLDSSSRLFDDYHLFLTARIAMVAQVPLVRRRLFGSWTEVTVTGRSLSGSSWRTYGRLEACL